MSDRQKIDNMIPMILDVQPLVLEVGSHLAKRLKETSPESSFSDRIADLRRETALSLGIVLPSVTVRTSVSMEPDVFVLKVREIEIRRGDVRGMHAPLQVHQELGHEVAEAISRYAHEFLGLNEVQALVSHLRSIHPEIVGSVYPSLLSLPEIQRILQNLLRERVPIRDLLKIFETLREYAIYTHDPDILTEYVRHTLARLLGSLYQKSFVISAYVLDREIEQLIAGAIRWEDGVFLEFDPVISERIVKTLMRRFQSLRNKKKENSVLLVSPDIRRFVRLLMERLAPEIPVLSTNEISPEYKVRTAGVISLDSWPAFLKRILEFVRMKSGPGLFPGDDLQKALLILNLLGPTSNPVVQCLSHREREALRGRAMIAPIPARGKELVIREFISYLPKEAKVSQLDSLIQFAKEDPTGLALTLQKHWLARYGLPEEEASGTLSHSRGRDETTSREKAAIFISAAARWVQEEVYRHLGVEDLKQLGYGMLQFPSISTEAKRKAWEDYESLLHKDEWWDPEALARFVQASAQGKIEEFKKRGFRQSQTLAVLLLSLPPRRVKQIGKEVLDRLPKNGLQSVLAEMGQWRDQIPMEARLSAISDFLDYMSSMEKPDFEFFPPQMKAEVERIVHRDLEGAASVLRNLWFSGPDPWSVFESLALQMPQRITHHLLLFYQRPAKESRPTNAQKVICFLDAIHSDLCEVLREKLSMQERDLLAGDLGNANLQLRLFGEFLHAYYGGSHPTPLPFLKRN